LERPVPDDEQIEGSDTVGTIGTAGTTGTGLLRGLKKGIRKILTGTFVPLGICLLMSDPR
jgi:hypothetical protein